MARVALDLAPKLPDQAVHQRPGGRRSAPEHALIQLQVTKSHGGPGLRSGPRLPGRAEPSSQGRIAENSPEPDLSELYTDVLVERY